MNPPTEHAVLERFQAWAEAARGVRAAVLTGSRVNPRATVDRFSDYDIELYVADLEPYRHGDAWLQSLGTVLAKCPWRPERAAHGWLTRMAVFAEGFRIDFQITAGAIAVDNYIDGYRVLFDPERRCRDLPAPTYAGYRVRKPSAADWDKFANEFWWDAIYIAKELARKELFYAKYTLDYVLRFEYLQKLIEWTICVEHGWEVQPNKLGREFRRFVNNERWARIERTFAGADIQANWTAFFAALALFRELAHEVAVHLGYVYPEALDRDVTAHISSFR